MSTKTAATIVVLLLALPGSFSAITRATVVTGVVHGAPADELSTQQARAFKWAS